MRDKRLGMSRMALSQALDKFGKGLNFAVSPKNLPIAELNTATESAICKGNIQPAATEELRHDVSILNAPDPPKQNILKSKHSMI